MNFLSHTERKNKEVLDTWLQGNVNGNESQREIALILKDRNGATDSNTCPRSIVAYDITRKTRYLYTTCKQRGWNWQSNGIQRCAGRLLRARTSQTGTRTIRNPRLCATLNTTTARDLSAHHVCIDCVKKKCVCVLDHGEL
mgnify:CR=1 FL=1